MISIIIFVIFFLAIVNWSQIISFSSLFVGPKIKTSTVKDEWINKIVRKKTGLKLLDITLFHDKKMYGMMAGLPFWPKMILTDSLLKNFNKDELEWVILHEAGHCVLWHNLKAFLVELSFITLGTLIIYFYELNLFGAILSAIILSLLCIQAIRWLIEYQADRFSIERVDNPRGVITAQEKIRNAKHKNLFSSEKSLGRFLLHWNIYPSKRIEMARNLSSN